jgi:hypothetical protein
MIAATSRRRLARFARFAANYLSTMAFIGLVYWIITDLSEFHRGMLQGQLQLGSIRIDIAIHIHELIIALIALYAIVLIPSTPGIRGCIQRRSYSCTDSGSACGGCGASPRARAARRS